MSDEELEVMITIDDPWYGPDEDIFHHLQPVTYWPSQPFPIIRMDQTFSEGSQQ